MSRKNSDFDLRNRGEEASYEHVLVALRESCFFVHLSLMKPATTPATDLVAN
jgi:hypothetical protein